MKLYLRKGRKTRRRQRKNRKTRRRQRGGGGQPAPLWGVTPSSFRDPTDKQSPFFSATLSMARSIEKSAQEVS